MSQRRLFDRGWLAGQLAAGVSIAEIARQAGVSRQAVRQAARREGMRSGKPECPFVCPPTVGEIEWDRVNRPEQVYYVEDLPPFEDEVAEVSEIQSRGGAR